MEKVVIIGTGFVGMSYAYALLNQSLCDEMVLIDIDRAKAEGEAMDLSHGLAFAGSNMRIYAGGYNDCSDADIIAICAGASQKSGETRISLLQRNFEIFSSIIGSIKASGFSGIFLIASNPVDIMTRVTRELSGFDHSRVIGSGTTLDSARLRYLLGEYFTIDPRSVHAYVIGEHGESEFVPWSQALIATKPILNVCDDCPDRYSYEGLTAISDEVRCAAERIIKAKNATYYGIGMALARITRAVFGNENSVLTVSGISSMQNGNTYAGAPFIINRKGAGRSIRLSLTDDELRLFNDSCNFLNDTYKSINSYSLS